MKKVNNVFSTEALEKIARDTGFLKRQRKVVPKAFLENIMFQTLNSPGSFDDLAHEFFIKNNCSISKQALQQKFNPAASNFVQTVLDQLLEATITESKSYLGAIDFINEVHVVDSSEIRLHNKLKDIFPQVRGQGAAIKLQALMNAVNNQILLLDVRPSKEPDQAYKQHLLHIKPNDLMLGDLGYFSVESFREIKEKGAFFLSRFFKKTNLYDPQNGALIDLRELLRQEKNEVVDLKVMLGISKFSCRLVAMKLPEDAYNKRLVQLKKKHRRDPRSQAHKYDILNQWTIFITNLPQLVVASILLKIYSLRWQIELLFKMMKTFLHLKKIDARNQYRALISLKVSLIAMVMLCLVTMTIVDREISLYKACKILVKNIGEFFENMNNKNKNAIVWLREILYNCALKETRQSRLSTKQSLRWSDIYA